ncbi:DUF5677 domain-containing protein [Bacillus cereus group sp. Bc062]|uniref:DUF5677 domain-containing protein n=1 Tax=Bacillus cereus group TaxID=86661 RepID=UPI000944A68E|nr:MULTISPECIES: DUF5677 domain-containing protein [Bacillus cereus group]MBE7145299.1 hypothetical protein [Bacillus paranthracis]MCU5211693.1 DUF5677 domain-containing protein [Bacillus paranthracis]MDA2146858.1 DUF5677 domain-containing protein [Bacillus cereus group sp. Bc248]MDA2174727.1 DUF5677 domain-containing protein [Bacillus cereus group sp. Bc247]MDA2588241.1 DUF5677 domain-containing protein [Bacillus cereus group sp. Bc062]
MDEITQDVNTLQWANSMIHRVSETFLMNHKKITLSPETKIASELLLLYGKQTNLLKSFLLLMENKHTEEAIIIFRSILNNAMLIQYISAENITTEDVELRFKKYKVQPVKSNIKKLEKYKDIKRHGVFDRAGFNDSMSYETLDERIEFYKEALIESGHVTKKGKADTTVLTVRTLAEWDDLLYIMYAQYYELASRFEHSDPTSLEIYKEPVNGNVPTTKSYIMNLNRTDNQLYDEIMNVTISIYGITFLKLFDYIENNIPELIQEQNTQELFDIAKEFDVFVHFND